MLDMFDDFNDWLDTIREPFRMLGLVFAIIIGAALLRVPNDIMCTVGFVWSIFVAAVIFSRWLRD